MSNPHFSMPKVMILVADAGKARFFTAEHPTGPLIELEAVANPEVRLAEHSLSDAPGRSFQSMGEARSAMEETTELKDQEVIKFARDLSGRLNKARSQGKIEKLFIVAAPSMLGELRKQMDSNVSALVVSENSKDIAHLDAATIRKHLPEYLK